MSDLEKRRVNTAISNIVSMLTHYSESTGRLVSDKRCCPSNMSLVGASLNISLGRIKQSFVLWVISISSILFHISKHLQTFPTLILHKILSPFRTDPHKSDFPIVYASDSFLELTGTWKFDLFRVKIVKFTPFIVLVKFFVRISIHGEIFDLFSSFKWYYYCY